MAPDHLRTIFTRLQLPHDDLAIISTNSNEACIVFQPLDSPDNTAVRMFPSKNTVFDPLVLPEFVN